MYPYQRTPMGNPYLSPICWVFMGNKIPINTLGTLLGVHQIVPWLIVHHSCKLRVHGLNPLPRTLKSQVPWPYSLNPQGKCISLNKCHLEGRLSSIWPSSVEVMLKLIPWIFKIVYILNVQVLCWKGVHQTVRFPQTNTKSAKRLYPPGN